MADLTTSGTPPVRAAMVQGEDGTWVPLTGGVAGPTTFGTPQMIGLMAQNADGAWAPWDGSVTPPNGPDGEPIEPGDFDARYVKKAGDTMTGGLSFGTAISSATDVSKHLSFERSDSTNQGDMSKGIYLYAGNDKIGINVSSKRLNLVCNYGDDAIDGLIGGAVRSRTHAGGLWVPDGHSVDTPKIARANIEYDATSTTGVHTFEVAGNRIVEIENSGIHVHGTGAVDTPTLIIKDQDSDERYWMRTETIAGTPGEKGDTGPKGDKGDKGDTGAQGIPGIDGSGVSATIGDVKSAFLLSDHGGWVCLNGRPILDLTATQQEACLTLGFAVNLPNAANAVLMQAGTMGVVSGSNSRTLTANQMPRHFHTVPAITNDQGVHGFGDMVNPASGRAYPLTIMRGSAEIININNQNPDSGHMPNYGRTMEDAGNDEAFDITPMSLAVNMFVYLGA